jgi:tRNA U34 5-methylaminomethyl-2-thiouridine-forming methyltransferase MnmC
MEESNSPDSRPVIPTKDGSHTVYQPTIGQHYHSIHGAIQESLHVFIKAGLNELSLEEVSIFEVGFGTGLNALLTMIDAEEKGYKVKYTAIEAFPLDISVVKELNYVEQLRVNHLNEAFLAMHQCPWGKWEEIKQTFLLNKIKGKIQETEFSEKYHLVYFDAFGPGVQPEMWEEPIFEKIISAMEAGGILTTYCAKGEVKRTLKRVGFVIENLQGPPGKREMVRARRRL